MSTYEVLSLLFFDGSFLIALLAYLDNKLKVFMESVLRIYGKHYNRLWKANRKIDPTSNSRVIKIFKVE